MYIRQISVFVENKGGELAQITDFLYKHNVNLRALSIADTAEFGILRIIVENPEETLSLLKNEGFTCTITDMIAVHMKDEPGSMAKIIRALADNNIFVEYAYAFPTEQKGHAILIFRVDNNAAAEYVLASTSFELKGSEILNS